MSNFFNKNDLASPIQSGVKLEVLCISELLPVINKICEFPEMDYGVRGVFLDIAKAFDKVMRIHF